MSISIHEVEALDLIGEMSQSTGVSVAVGVNTYIENQDPHTFYTILIDPSSLSDEDETTIEMYAKKRALTILEEWNDWGDSSNYSNQ
jgi:hypothetical protein